MDYQLVTSIILNPPTSDTIACPSFTHKFYAAKIH